MKVGGWAISASMPGSFAQEYDAGAPACRVPRNSPALVAASTRSVVAPLVASATEAGSRTRRNTPRPCRTASPDSASHGLSPTGRAAAPLPTSTPRPPHCPVTAPAPGTASPVPTSTKSSLASAPKLTSRLPQD